MLQKKRSRRLGDVGWRDLATLVHLDTLMWKNLAMFTSITTIHRRKNINNQRKAATKSIIAIITLVIYHGGIDANARGKLHKDTIDASKSIDDSVSNNSKTDKKAAVDKRRGNQVDNKVMKVDSRAVHHVAKNNSSDLRM